MLRRVSTTVGPRDATSPVNGRHAAGDGAAAVHDLLASFIRVIPRDISLTSIATLSTLDRTGPRRITELAASEGVTQPSVTSLVASLVRAGYVERRSDPDDKRVVMVAITEAGSAYLRTRREATRQAFVDAADKLPADEAAVLAAALPVIEHLRDLVDEQRSLGRDRK
jgi:DNA-binding MarR family transcriptional regulator